MPQKLKKIPITPRFLEASKMQLIELLQSQPGLSFRNLQEIMTIGRDLMNVVLDRCQDVIYNNGDQYFVRRSN